jgi:hypothetical protein
MYNIKRVKIVLLFQKPHPILQMPIIISTEKSLRESENLYISL